MHADIGSGLVSQIPYEPDELAVDHSRIGPRPIERGGGGDVLRDPGGGSRLISFFACSRRLTDSARFAYCFPGTDADGVIGLKHIKAQGGVTIAQDPSEAEYHIMPRAANRYRNGGTGCCGRSKCRRNCLSLSKTISEFNCQRNLPLTKEVSPDEKSASGRKDCGGADARSGRRIGPSGDASLFECANRARFFALQARHGAAPNCAAFAGEFAGGHCVCIWFFCARTLLSRAPSSTICSSG